MPFSQARLILSLFFFHQRWVADFNPLTRPAISSLQNACCVQYLGDLLKPTMVTMLKPLSLVVLMQNTAALNPYAVIYEVKWFGDSNIIFHGSLKFVYQFQSWFLYPLNPRQIPCYSFPFLCALVPDYVLFSLPIWILHLNPFVSQG